MNHLRSSNYLRPRPRGVVEGLYLRNQPLATAQPLGPQRRPSSSAHERQRLSTTWLPTGGVSAGNDEDAYGKLVRAGFIRQAHSGIFHFLPLGLRVQSKLESLLDHHMHAIGATRVSLSSITSQELWRKSGRFSKSHSELFCFSDRRKSQYMLSPTHEEEITSLVSENVQSYKELPLRLYQITRKFRDELRPRHGLLRSREFVMKDLYTFDWSSEHALRSYEEVQSAYASFFGQLKLPFLVARACSGDMGGDLSHEYHFPSAIGEDTVVSCDSCEYVANAEIAEARVTAFPTKTEVSPSLGMQTEDGPSLPLRVWRGITKDRRVLVNAWYPHRATDDQSWDEKISSGTAVNIHAIKNLIDGLDTSLGDPLPLWKAALDGERGEHSHNDLRLLNLVDSRVVNVYDNLFQQFGLGAPIIPDELEVNAHLQHATITMAGNGRALDLLPVQDGDACVHCKTGKLKMQKALEVGHTFYLGTRYSEPLSATVSVPPTACASETAAARQGFELNSLGSSYKVPLQMGCHGIGVTRLIGAVAEHLADDKGLQWPRSIAPYEVVILSNSTLASEAFQVYDARVGAGHPHFDSSPQGIDVVLDDRRVSLAWKMKDADLVGYPIIVILGRAWADGQCEVQCRRLSVKTAVPLTQLRHCILELLDKL